MKVLRNPADNLVLQVGNTIERITYEGLSNVIKVITDYDTFYIATEDRDTYEITDRNDIPSDYYPSGYYLENDVWTYITPQVFPEPWEVD